MASGLLEREACASAADAARPTWVRSHRLELLLLGGVLLLALALRLAHLALVPQFTDESLEVLWSLPISRGEAFPLTNYDAYYGALFNYLVAGAFVLLGPSALAARVVVLVAGVLTVLATYALARAWNGPLAGLLAAGLMAVNAAHAAINSHIAWANCTTPLFTTLAVWWLWAGTGRRGDGATGRRRDGEMALSPRLRVSASPRLLVASGLLWGLALQTHLLVATLLPGVALYLFWKGRPLLRTPWPYLALLAFLVGYANVIAHNVQSGFESLTAAQRIRHTYAGDEDAATSYPAALGAALLLLARVLGSAVDARESPWGYLADPFVLLGAGLAAAGLWREARRGNPLPLLLVVSCLALLPAVNPKFRTLISSRYLMPLVPVLLAAAAGLLVGGLRPGRGDAGTRGRGDAGRIPISASPSLRVAASVVLVLVLTLSPLPPLARYYDRAFATGENNERAYRLAGLVAEHHRPGELLVLDEAFGSETGGVSELRALRYLLAFGDTPVEVIKITPKRLEEELGSAPSLLVVLSGRQLREMDRLPLKALTPLPQRGSEVGLFRLATKA